MKTFKSILLSTAVIAVVLFSAAQSVAQGVAFFDENGNFGGAPGFAPVAANFPLTDPLQTTAPFATLAYLLPYPTVSGELRITENPTGVSDVVRWESGQTSTTVYFYSDNGGVSDPGDAVADV